MKKFVCILALIIISLFATNSVKAIGYCGYDYYTVSDVWNVGGTIYGYSATELGYCAGLYNDPVVSGILLENISVIGQGYAEGYSNQYPAVIGHNYSSPAAGQTYTTIGDHYLIAYYQVYVPHWNDWFWYDPWQLGFLEAGGGYEAPGYYGFGYAYYWTSQYIYIGTTTDSMVYCGQTQCQQGQQFTSTGVSCNFQPPSGVCGEPEPPKPKVSIQSVGFKGDYKIKRHADYSIIDSNDDDPMWVKGGSNNNEPVAYTKGTFATIFATFKVEKIAPDITNAMIRMKVGNQTFATIQNVNVSTITSINESLKFDNIVLTGPNQEGLPNSDITRMKKYEFIWEISFDNGANWAGIGKSGDHKIHWIFGAFNPNSSDPKERQPIWGTNPVNGNATDINGIWDLALENSTEILGDGSNNPEEIAKKITEHIRIKILYAPGEPPSSRTNPLDPLLLNNPRRQCSDNATTLFALLRTIGIRQGEIKFTRGGEKATNKIHYYWHPNITLVPPPPPPASPVIEVPPPTKFPDGYMTSQYKREPEDESYFLNPRFNFHATVIFPIPNATPDLNDPQAIFRNRISFDPSFGKVDESGIKFKEVVNSAGECLKDTAAENADWQLISDNLASPVANKINKGDPCSSPRRDIPAPRKSAFIIQSIPSDLQIGQNYSVSITLQNNGTNTWKASEGYQLGSQSPENNMIWGFNRINLPNDVEPGQQVTFNFNITAPMTSGFYDFQWRMLQDGVEWFGDPTPVVPIEAVGQVQCDYSNQQACYWQGGYWNSNLCQCEGIY